MQVGSIESQPSAFAPKDVQRTLALPAVRETPFGAVAEQVSRGCGSRGELAIREGQKWGFPKISGTILGVPIIRIIVCWGLFWGPPILGNYQMLRMR